MIVQPSTQRRDRTVAEVVTSARRYTSQILFFFQATLAILPVIVLASGRLEHASALAMICLGVGLNVTQWCRSTQTTLPLICLLSIQDLLWYGTPLLVNHKSLGDYSPEMAFRSGFCLLLYLGTLAVTRGFTTKRFAPGTRNIPSLDLRENSSTKSLQTVLLLGLVACAVLEWAFVTGSIWPYLSRLPQGSVNVLRTGMAAGECGAGFLFAFLWARRRLPSNARLGVAVLFTAIISARIASILLSSTVAVVGALLLGAFIGAGRVPWRAIALTVVGLGFLNVGKFDMRKEHWDSGSNPVTLTGTPGYFAEWISASASKLTGGSSDKQMQTVDRGQPLTERLSNIQMLLYVDKAITDSNYPWLWGETYRASWHVVVPRVLWPDKPRSHIGQEILNVHFGRQTREQTFRTYIAWGLLPEAVGNFGMWMGPIFLGVVLGISLGWVEQYTADLSLFALPSILACFLLISLTGSSGMVVGVWIASLLQTSVVLVFGLYPFAHWTRV